VWTRYEDGLAEPPLNASEAERIARYLCLEMPPDQADVAFVFGTRHPDPAQIAASLLRQGTVRYVVLTGGKSRYEVEEAATHRAILVQEGVAEEQIVVESASTNTLENVMFALPLIAVRIGWEYVQAIVVVTKWYHCRRAVMTLKRHMPAGVRYSTVTYEPDGVPRVGWHLDPEARRRVLKEWDSIPRYLAQGDIAEVHRQGDALI
jgi:uncharacterized SAM-binding protein YcdF (DUF218 family)